MDTLTEIFPNLGKYLELMPVCLMGLLSGIVSYFNGSAKDSNMSIGLCLVVAEIVEALQWIF